MKLGGLAAWAGLGWLWVGFGLVRVGFGLALVWAGLDLVSEPSNYGIIRVIGVRVTLTPMANPTKVRPKKV